MNAPLPAKPLLALDQGELGVAYEELQKCKGFSKEYGEAVKNSFEQFKTRQDQVAKYRQELETKAEPAFAEIKRGIDEIRNHQGDPDKIAVQMADGAFKTLPQLLNLLSAQKAEASKQIDDAADKCARGLKPLQGATDDYVAIATGGLSELLPKRMTHIELGEIILNGKPFGGDGGLVPHLRDQLLGLFHIDPHNNGFGVGIIIDPINTILGRR